MTAIVHQLRATVRNLAGLVGECVDAINTLRGRPTVVNVTVNVFVLGDVSQWEIVQPGELCGDD